MPKKKLENIPTKPTVEIAIKPRKRRLANKGTRTVKRREWEPTARQWAIYDAIVRGGTSRFVAAQFEMTFQNVSKTCERIDNYLAQIYIDRVRRIRERHTSYLEHIFCEAMAAWEKSKFVAVTTTEETGDNDGKPAKKSKSQKTEQYGDAACLREARSALADIRKIHAVDKNPKIDEFASDDSGDRVAGKNREQVIQERINSLNASLKASRALSGVKEQASEQAG